MKRERGKEGGEEASKRDIVEPGLYISPLKTLRTNSFVLNRLWSSHKQHCVHLLSRDAKMIDVDGTIIVCVLISVH